jgi:hypothetical protein
MIFSGIYLPDLYPLSYTGLTRLNGSSFLDKQLLLYDIASVKHPSPELNRVQQLLDKLEQRATTCPGLYPVRAQLEFLNLASDHQLQQLLALEDLPLLPAPDIFRLSLTLEQFWRDPTLCQQILSQSLLRHQSVTLCSYLPNTSSQNSWFLLLQKFLPTHSKTACQNKELKSA